MTVSIDTGVFENADNFQSLNHLFVLFEKGKHTLYLNNDISHSAWVNDTNNITRTFCEVEFKNSAYLSQNDVKLKICNSNEIENNIYSVEDAYILLDNDSIVWIENGTSDKLFLLSIIDNFRECDEIKKNIKNRWIDFRGVGGKNEFIKEINNELKKFRRETLPNEKYIRALIILDSDRKYPKETLSDYHLKLQEYCIEKNINCHILEKREMENYLPNDAFIGFSHTHPIVNSYLSLNNLQQSYYDFEDGFKGKNINSFDENTQNLFDGMPPADEAHLRVGFDRAIKDGFYSKKEIPKLFKSKNISRENLLIKCEDQENPEEIMEIIKKLQHLL